MCPLPGEHINSESGNAVRPMQITEKNDNGNMLHSDLCTSLQDHDNAQTWQI